jgi:hypothetical protein
MAAAIQITAEVEAEGLTPRHLDALKADLRDDVSNLIRRSYPELAAPGGRVIEIEARR